MATVKQIVEALLCLAESKCNLTCQACAYDSDYCNEDVLDDAAEALKKLVPHKPKRSMGAIFCPSCGAGYSILMYAYPEFIRGTHYCPDCGQAIDWSGDDADS